MKKVKIGLAAIAAIAGLGGAFAFTNHAPVHKGKAFSPFYFYKGAGDRRDPANFSLTATPTHFNCISGSDTCLYTLSTGIPAPAGDPGTWGLELAHPF
jgi:hypothetical protein